MEIEIVAKTGKGRQSTEEEVSQTLREALEIAHKIGGAIIDGKGYASGTKILVRK